MVEKLFFRPPPPPPPLPPKFQQRRVLKRISNTRSKALKCYDNIVLAGDLNIDLLDPSKDFLNHLSDLLDVFNLKIWLRNLFVSCLTKGL